MYLFRLHMAKSILFICNTILFLEKYLYLNRHLQSIITYRLSYQHLWNLEKIKIHA